LPECLAQLRRWLEERLKKHGSREYVQVLRLLETFDLSEVTHAVEQAFRRVRSASMPCAICCCAASNAGRPRLDMKNYPHLPLAQVHTTQAAAYMSLLVEVAVEACA